MPTLHLIGEREQAGAFRRVAPYKTASRPPLALFQASMRPADHPPSTQVEFTSVTEPLIGPRSQTYYRYISAQQ